MPEYVDQFMPGKIRPALTRNNLVRLLSGIFSIFAIKIYQMPHGRLLTFRSRYCQRNLKSAGIFFSNFGFAIMIFMLLLVVILILNQFPEKKLNIPRLSATYNEIEILLVRMTNSLDAVNARLQSLKIIDCKLLEKQSRQISEIADGFHSQSQMTKAIELARGGATIQDIMLATNLPEEEAEAIVKFHGDGTWPITAKIFRKYAHSAGVRR